MADSQLRFGIYEVIGPLGSGGMGDVYRARDPRLQRDVAIKVLSDRQAANEESVARFHRESQILAALNHPSIASIYDVVEDGSRLYIVMELIEGPTLAERLLQGPLDAAEAVRLAIEIARAIEAAHERGIVHRDLKPANVKLAAAGIKVLDFGLARDQARPETQNSGDTPTALTAADVILGTVAYMAPESIAGKPVTVSVDVWAFGCLLYEMLCRLPPFHSNSNAETMAAILRGEPDWSRLPRDTPATVQRILRRCLRKDPRERWHHMGDVRLELEDIQEGAAVAATRPAPRSPWLTVAVATLALAFVGTLAVLLMRPRPSPSPEMRLDIVTPPTSRVSSFALSPDGTRIVYVANDEGHSKLWLRALNSTTATTMPGTDFAVYPFWSPDSKSVGFFSEGQLKRLDLDGGFARPLASAPVPRGGAWGTDGLIYFAPVAAGSLYRVPEKGGQAEPLMAAGAGLVSQRFPVALADGRIIFKGLSDKFTTGILDADRKPQPFSDGWVAGSFAGGIVIRREGKLTVAPFAPGQRVPGSNETAISTSVANDEYTHTGVSVSFNGVIAYRQAGSFIRHRLEWFDRAGHSGGRLTEVDSSSTSSPSLSPDGTHVAIHLNMDGTDVWTVELGRGTTSKITTADGADIFPVWSPDGSKLVFASNRNGVFDLFKVSATGSRQDEPLLLSRSDKLARDWSGDGKYVLYEALDTANIPDIWALPMNGDAKPVQITHSPAAEQCPQFSPDSRWIAFQSNASGRFEIYLQRFNDDSSLIQVSTGGGTQARWNRNGNELFYVARNGDLVSATLKRNAKDGIEVAQTTKLFSTHIGDAVFGQDGIQYLVSPDGQRFLINTITDEIVLPITVILNWRAPR